MRKKVARLVLIASMTAQIMAPVHFSAFASQITVPVESTVPDDTTVNSAETEMTTENMSNTETTVSEDMTTTDSKAEEKLEMKAAAVAEQTGSIVIHSRIGNAVGASVSEEASDKADLADYEKVFMDYYRSLFGKEGDMVLNQVGYVNNYTEADLSGFEYQLLDSQAQPVKTLKSDSKGDVEFTDVPYGKYSILLVKPGNPNVSTYLRSVAVTVGADSESPSLMFEHEYKDFGVTLKVVDAATGQPITGKGFNFSLYRETDDSISDVVQAPKPSWDLVVGDRSTNVEAQNLPKYNGLMDNGAFVVRNSTGYGLDLGNPDHIATLESIAENLLSAETEGTAYTDPMGIVQASPVLPGNYMLIMHSAPEGYAMPQKPFMFTIGDNVTEYTYTVKLPEVSGEPETTSTTKPDTGDVETTETTTESESTVPENETDATLHFIAIDEKTDMEVDGEKVVIDINRVKNGASVLVERLDVTGEESSLDIDSEGTYTISLKSLPAGYEFAYFKVGDSIFTDRKVTIEDFSEYLNDGETSIRVFIKESEAPVTEEPTTETEEPTTVTEAPATTQPMPTTKPGTDPITIPEKEVKVNAEFGAETNDRLMSGVSVKLERLDGSGNPVEVLGQWTTDSGAKLLRLGVGRYRYSEVTAPAGMYAEYTEVLDNGNYRKVDGSSVEFDVLKESADMKINIGYSVLATTQPPVTQPPVTQAPQTQAPETQAPETQAPQTQAPQTQAPETQAPQTQAPQQQQPAQQQPQGQTGYQEPATQPVQTQPVTTGFIGDNRTYVYHLANSPAVENIPDFARAYFADEQAAIAAGYTASPEVAAMRNQMTDANGNLLMVQQVIKTPKLITEALGSDGEGKTIDVSTEAKSSDLVRYEGLQDHVGQQVRVVTKIWDKTAGDFLKKVTPNANASSNTAGVIIDPSNQVVINQQTSKIYANKAIKQYYTYDHPLYSAIPEADFVEFNTESDAQAAGYVKAVNPNTTQPEHNNAPFPVAPDTTPAVTPPPAESTQPVMRTNSEGGYIPNANPTAPVPVPESQSPGYNNNVINYTQPGQQGLVNASNAVFIGNRMTMQYTNMGNANYVSLPEDAKIYFMTDQDAQAAGFTFDAGQPQAPAPEAQAPVVTDGDHFMIENRMILEKAEGELKVTAQFDTTNLEGHELVYFQYFYDEQGNVIVQEANPDSQTQVLLVSSTPRPGLYAAADTAARTLAPYIAAIAGLAAVVSAIFFTISRKKDAV